MHDVYKRARVSAQTSRREKVVEALRTEIKRRYDQKNPDRELRLNRIAVKRIRDIEGYLAGRYGRILHESDDAAAEDLVILLNHIAQNPVDPQAKMRASIRSWAPWMDHDEKRDLVERIAKKPRRYRAKTLGQLMRLTDEEHTLWGLESIRAFTTTDADMKAKELLRERARKADKRRAEGVVTREEYLAGSKSRTKPWEAVGVSRRTWERRRKAGTTDADASPSAPVRISVPDDLHPAGRATIDHWLMDMRDAADHGDAATVARLAGLVKYKIELEQQFQREDEAPWQAPHVE